MILSGLDIKHYLERGILEISPVDPSQFQQNGVDLVLSEIDRPEDWTNTPSFHLGATVEKLSLPNDLMGFVQLRSTWARKGVLIPPTIVDAGFKGNLTVEIYNVACQESPVGERLLHLILVKMMSPGEPYRGKYQGQSGITFPR